MAEMVVKTEIQWMLPGVVRIRFGMKNSNLVQDESKDSPHNQVSARTGAQLVGGDSELLTKLC